MSRSRHSCSECLGGSKTWSASSSLSWPVKSSIGEMSRSTSATPSSRNHWKDSRWTAIRSGSWRTSRSLAKERRSRDARRANVTPLRAGARRPAPEWSASARTGRHGYRNLSARLRSPATRVHKIRRRGDAVLGRIRRPSRRVKSHWEWKPRIGRPVSGDGQGAVRRRIRPARSRPGSKTRAERARRARRVRGLGRNSGPGRRHPSPASSPCPPAAELLELDFGAGAFELGLGLLGVLLGHLLEHGLGGRLDEVLGLLQPQAGEGADLLDDLDLLGAGFGEDDIELVLLLCGRLSLGGRAGGRAGSHGDGGGGGDAELLLERLQELVELENAHVLEDVEQLVGAELCGHGDYSSSGSCSCPWS